jgi:putative FmdB family regulatory protein
MPLYDFYCEHCGQFEQMAGSDDGGQMVACPTCNKNSKRLYSAPTYTRVFVGSRHTLIRRSEKISEPRLVRKAVGEPLPGTKPMPHAHGSGCCSGGSTNLGYPPWMMKH